MKIKIYVKVDGYLSAKTTQKKINGYLNKILDNNPVIHDNIGIYNISDILGGKYLKILDSFTYPNNVGHFYFSTSIEEIFDKCVIGFNRNRKISDNIIITHAEEVKFNHSFSGINSVIFNTITPIVVKHDSFEISSHDELKKLTNNKKFMNVNDPNIDEKLTRLMLTKYNYIKEKYTINSIDTNNFNVSFDRTYKNSHGVVRYFGKDKYFFGNVCPIIITGSRDMIEFCYDNGIGNYTKLGYGTI